MLAIVAYGQPINRAEIEAIRGVEVYGVLRTLLERELVRMMGRKAEAGRPMLYGTSQQFLEHFGLRELGDLPTLREINELIGITESGAGPEGAPVAAKPAPTDVGPDPIVQGPALATEASEGPRVVESAAEGEQPTETAFDADRATETGAPGGQSSG